MTTKLEENHRRNEVIENELSNNINDEHSSFNEEILEKDDPDNYEFVKAQIIDEMKIKTELIQKNNFLQHQLSIYIKETEKNDYFNTLEIQMDENEESLKEKMKKIDEKQLELSCYNHMSNEQIEEIKSKLLGKEEEYKEIKSLFKEIKQKTALNSVNSENGEHYSKAEVDEVIEKEEKLLKHLEHIQLESIGKKQILQKTIDEKRNLGYGPLDFGEYEMMCTAIENNTEIIKHLKQVIKGFVQKSTKAVIVLSHLTQKMHLLEQEKLLVNKKEQLLEKLLSQMKYELFEETRKYDIMNKKNEESHHKHILLQYPRLIEDYQEMLTENEATKKEIERLEKLYKTSQKILKQRYA